MLSSELYKNRTADVRLRKQLYTHTERTPTRFSMNDFILSTYKEGRLSHLLEINHIKHLYGCAC